MTPETTFSLASAWVLPGWLLIAILPGWKWTPRLVFYMVIFVLAVVYAYLLFSNIRGFQADSFNSLESVTSMFSDPVAVLTGWIHYLAFDLLAGLFIAIDGRRKRIHQLIMIFPLFFTFMFGPVGLLLYTVIRYAKVGRAEVPLIHD